MMKKKSIQEQIDELQRTIYNSLDLPSQASKDLSKTLSEAADLIRNGTPVGKCMGEDIYAKDVIYDPESGKYKIRMKDGQILVADPSVMQTKVDIPYKDLGKDKSFDDWYKTYAGTRVAGVTAHYGKASDSQSKASVHVRTKNKSYYDWNDGKYVDTGKPWEDPLKNAHDKASNTVACTDIPPSWAKGGFDLQGKPEVYFHDRWPKKPANVLVDEAIALLRDNKHIDICIRSKDCNMDYRGKHQSVYLSYQINRQYAPNSGKRIVVDVELKQRAFDRINIELDRYARLRGKWNTDTYITARIAYILMEAAKLTDGDARDYTSDLLNILGHNTSPYFIY